MISTRYAAATALILALALVPTGIHSYWGAEADGLTAGAVPAILDGHASTDTRRRAGWAKDILASDDWVERGYQTAGGEVVLFVGRSYDAKRLYHHPELALLRGTETEPAGIARSSIRPDIPLHLLKTEKGNRHGIAVYALLYDGRFIENPVTFQLRTSVELLVGRRKPMTLFLASDLSGDIQHIDDASSTRLLLAAIAAFESQPRTAEHSETSRSRPGR